MNALQRFRKARTRFHTVEEITRLVDPANRENVLDYIELLIRTLQFKKAHRLAQAVVDADSTEASAWYFLGQCHFFLEKMSDSETALIVARKKDPDMYQVNYFLAQVYLKMGRFREAYEIAIEQIELHKNNPKMVNHVPFMWIVRADAENALFNRHIALNSIVRGMHSFPDNSMLELSFQKYSGSEAAKEMQH